MDWMCKVFGRGAVAAMCYEGGEGASSPKI
jgi:hypothetical protein